MDKELAIQVKTVKDINTCNKTVGLILNRYRLGHLWVPEMVLNVQSKESNFKSHPNLALYLLCENLKEDSKVEKRLFLIKPPIIL